MLKLTLRKSNDITNINAKVNQNSKDIEGLKGKVGTQITNIQQDITNINNNIDARFTKINNNIDTKNQ